MALTGTYSDKPDVYCTPETDSLTLIDSLPTSFDSEEQFQTIKRNLEIRLAVYQNRCYTTGEEKAAKDDKRILKQAEKAIVAKRRENRRNQLALIEDIQNKYKELEAMVGVPIAQIDSYLDDEESKRLSLRYSEFKEFYDRNSECFGLLADDIFYSPEFCNSKWDNKTTKAAKWQTEMLAKIRQVEADIDRLQAETGEQFKAVFMRYLEDFDVENALSYYADLNRIGQPASYVEACCDRLCDSEENDLEPCREEYVNSKNEEANNNRSYRITLKCAPEQWSRITAFLDSLELDYDTEIVPDNELQAL